MEFCDPITTFQPWMNHALALSLAAPHILYAFIWFNPKVWRKLMGNNSVEAFAMAGYAGKVLQFSAAVLWFWCSSPTGLCLNPSAISFTQWMFFLLALAVGQALNMGIYRAIGTNGVYYGFKLGKQVPWHNGFPFNVVSHPQYVGSALSVWAFAALVYNQIPSPTLTSNPVLLTAAYWTGLYVMTGVQEQYF